MITLEPENIKIPKLYHREEIISSLNIKTQAILFLIHVDLKDFFRSVRML